MFFDDKAMTVNGDTDYSQAMWFDLQRFSDENVDVEAQEETGDLSDVKGEDPFTANETIMGSKQVEASNSPPEKYDIALPEGTQLDEMAYNEFSEIARSVGLSNDAANKLAGYGLSFAQKAQEAVMQQQEQMINNWGEEARKELGVKFDTTVTQAGIGIEALEKVIPNIRQALNETGAGNRVEIIKAIAYLGEMVGEDSGKGLGGGKVSTGGSSMYPNTNFEKY